MGITVPPTIKEGKGNSDEITLTENQYQNMFQGCTELTQVPEMFPRRGVAEPVSPISADGVAEPVSPISADGFDWSENELNAYKL